MQQETLNVLGLQRQHFTDQVIRYVAVVSGKTMDEISSVGVPLQREGCQMKPSNPALRAGFKRGDVIHGELQPHDPVQEIGCFRF